MQAIRVHHFGGLDSLVAEDGVMGVLAAKLL